MAKSSKVRKNTNPWTAGVFSSLVLLTVFIFLQANSSNILALDVKWLVVASIPLLIALLRSNIIQKFKGFGIELETRLQTPIGSINLTAVDALVYLPGDEKQSAQYLTSLSNAQRANIRRLVFHTGREDYYRAEAINIYLHALTNVEFFEVVEANGEFIALLPIEIFKNRDYVNYEMLNNFIKSLVLNEITTRFGEYAITETLPEDENLLDALKQVRKSKYKLMPVVSDSRHFVGVVTLRMIESKIADEVLFAEA